jgi:hypothetical protein
MISLKKIEKKTVEFIYSFHPFIIALSILIMSASCTPRDPKIDDKNLIPEKDLIAIITDAYFVDGILALPSYNNLYTSFDSISAYTRIVEKHGYTKERMDKTMKYYFLRDPENLIKIYDKVLGILTEMESRVAKDYAAEINKIVKLWIGEESYSFPGNTSPDSTSFDLLLQKQGNYLLSYSATFYPEDQSVNPCINSYYVRADSLETGKKYYIKELNYIKDGRPHDYKIILNINSIVPVRIRGSLYDSEKCQRMHEKHAQFSNVSFTFN